MTQQVRYTKTFIERTWWRRNDGADELAWQQIAGSTPDVALDEQVTAFVVATGAIIVHPGQLGLHTQWHDQNMRLKQVVIGLTILYMKGEQDGPGNRQGPEAAGGAGGATRQDGRAGEVGAGAAGVASAGPAAAPSGDGPAAGGAAARAAAHITAAVVRPPITTGAPVKRTGAGAAASGGCGDPTADSVKPGSGPDKATRANPLSGVL